MDWFSLILALIFLISAVNSEAAWRWQCVTGYCQKFRMTPETRLTAMSLAACRLFCSESGGIWPKVNGQVRMGNNSVSLNLNSVKVLNTYANSPIGKRIRSAAKRFQDILEKIEPNGTPGYGGKSMNVAPYISNTNITRLDLNINESYSLTLEDTPHGITVAIMADNYFGFRHGLETLSQLVIYDDIRDEYQIIKDIYIEDKPVYKYRGIMLDTARNYISVDTIKRSLEGMACSKLNTFHWHITDSHSFPFVSKSRPQLSKLGAYSSKKVYTPEDIADIIEYGLVRGVRVMPELDAPAHVGEGWQETGFLSCFKETPWQNFCVEPPCGQLDPTQEKLYDFLEDIYHDIIEQFHPDIFHMGGDEVSFHCWNATPSIVEWMETKKSWSRSEYEFVKLWDMFQTKALQRYTKQAGKKIPIVLWTSTLTNSEYIESYLPKDQYIIQIWQAKKDYLIQDILSKGYQIILSNYDALYLDCGFSNWVGSGGGNWCSPYKGWQIIYDNSPANIAYPYASQVLGAEAALWTEQVDDSSVDGRLWPRASALAERLWTEPDSTWRHAEHRMLIHRERLVKRGIRADTLQPEWCMQNEENCPHNGLFNNHHTKSRRALRT